tara:strand:+ start:303 stop:464 length:162 start_codon:yes stop_codon:yes gene_type:complete
MELTLCTLREEHLGPDLVYAFEITRPDWKFAVGIALGDHNLSFGDHPVVLKFG